LHACRSTLEDPPSEPFYKLFNQGIILGPDGQKMSKSKGNVINPDEVIKKYGADSLRMFEMFLGPLETEKPWSDEGIRGIFRFLTRVWKLYQNLKNVKKSEVKDKELELSLNDLIFEVTDKIEKLRFNLAISKLMVFENLLTKKIQKEANLYHKKIFLEFIKLLFPFAPHICQEIWHGLGKKTFLDKEKWPVFKKIVQKIDSYQFVVQVNGKKRGFIVFNKSEPSEKEVKEKIKETPIYSRFLKGKKILKIVFVKGKLVNFVVE
jgi:Leucyl-tRNA synthetase